MPRVLLTVLAALLLFLAPSLGAAEVSATVAKITGKAQLQKGEAWVPLAIGQKLTPGDTISTGFRSELQLQIGPSTIRVKALSRLTLQNLVQEGTSLQTDLYLKVGKVDAEVNKSEDVQSQKFKVGSPVATASVRGTSFSFDGSSLQVYRGLVDFSDGKGNTVSIPVGEAARTGRSGIASNQTLVVQDSVVDPQAGADPSFADEATLEWTGFSYEDLLNQLYEFSWSGDTGASFFSIGGITPMTLPAPTYINLGGITALPIPPQTVISIGGIDP